MNCHRSQREWNNFTAHAMTPFQQQRGHFQLFEVLAGVVITTWDCESSLGTSVSCAFHVVLTHSQMRKGHGGVPLTDMSNENILSRKHWLRWSLSARWEPALLFSLKNKTQKQRGGGQRWHFALNIWIFQIKCNFLTTWLNQYPHVKKNMENVWVGKVWITNQRKDKEKKLLKSFPQPWENFHHLYCYRIVPWISIQDPWNVMCLIYASGSTDSSWMALSDITFQTHWLLCVDFKCTPSSYQNF